MISEFIHKVTFLKLILYICFIYLYISFSVSPHCPPHGLHCCWQEAFRKEKNGKNHGLQGGCGEGDGTPLQYSCLENPMNGGAW